MKKILIILLCVLVVFNIICCFGCEKNNSTEFDNGFSTTNNGFAKDDELVEKLISVTPSQRQLDYQEMLYYNFIHFGMNTMTDKEWGEGKDSPMLFNPQKLNTDDWVKALLDSGSKGVILTAKHHDGFCLWPSKYTDYTIEYSPYKNGEGDIVKELSDSCKKYGLKFGVYLSPWDRHELSYGTKEYDDFYCNQLEELLTNYGEIFSVWMDGAKGSDAPDFEYDFDRYFTLIKKLQPNAVISISGPDVRWIGNEKALCRESEWSVVTSGRNYNENSQTSEDTSNLEVINEKEKDLGSRSVLENYPKESLVWYPAEADVSIRRKTINLYGGWFYHNKEKNKSVDDLVKMYLDTAGKNASFLLNVPPTKTGEFDEDTIKTLKEFGDAIKNITKNKVEYTAYSGSKQNKIKKNNSIKNEMTKYPSSSYMLKNDEDIIDLKFKKKTEIKYLIIKEDLTHSQRIEQLDVYYLKSNGEWEKVESCTTIGQQRIIKIDKKTKKIRIMVRQSRSNPYFRSIEVFS